MLTEDQSYMIAHLTDATKAALFPIVRNNCLESAPEVFKIAAAASAMVLSNHPWASKAVNVAVSHIELLTTLATGRIKDAELEAYKEQIAQEKEAFQAQSDDGRKWHFDCNTCSWVYVWDGQYVPGDPFPRPIDVPNHPY